MARTRIPAPADYYVVEADESDKSFTYLDPAAVHGHEHRGGPSGPLSRPRRDLRSSSSQFIGSAPSRKAASWWRAPTTRPRLAQLAQSHGSHRVHVRLRRGSCDARVTSWEPQGVGSAFTLVLARRHAGWNGSRQAEPGHVTTCSNAAGRDRASGRARTCRGRGRRLALARVSPACAAASTWRARRHGVTVVDDYAHHPTGDRRHHRRAPRSWPFKPCARAVPAAPLLARASCSPKCCRTSSAAAFDAADGVAFMDVYPAGETPVPGVSGRTFMNVVLEHEGHPAVQYVPHRMDVVPALMKIAGARRPGRSPWAPAT